MGKGVEEINWKVVSEVNADNFDDEEGYCGVKKEFGFDKMSLADAIILLWPGDLWEQKDLMNKVLCQVVNPDRKNRRLRAISEVSNQELFTFLGLIIAATQFNVNGRSLWRKPGEEKTFTEAPNFGKHMNYSRFCEIKKIVPIMMVSEDGKDSSDPWWKHRGFIDGFNSKRQEVLNISRL